MKTFTILLFTTALNGTAFAQSLQVAPNGNVGIGTTTPSAKLTVTNGDDARLNLFSNGGN